MQAFGGTTIADRIEKCDSHSVLRNYRTAVLLADVHGHRVDVVVDGTASLQAPSADALVSADSRCQVSVVAGSLSTAHSAGLATGCHRYYVSPTDPSDPPPVARSLTSRYRSTDPGWKRPLPV